jgi:hypothetical protein
MTDHPRSVSAMQKDPLSFGNAGRRRMFGTVQSKARNQGVAAFIHPAAARTPVIQLRDADASHAPTKP